MKQLSLWCQWWRKRHQFPWFNQAVSGEKLKIWFPIPGWHHLWQKWAGAGIDACVEPKEDVADNQDQDAFSKGKDEVADDGGGEGEDDEAGVPHELAQDRDEKELGDEGADREDAKDHSENLSTSAILDLEEQDIEGVGARLEELLQDEHHKEGDDPRAHPVRPLLEKVNKGFEAFLY